MEINFNANIIETKFSDSILNLLPTVNNTLKNQMFFDSSVNEFFKKGSGVKINGYIGNKLNWYNKETDFYINEISDERNEYQLEPSMVTVIDGEYTNAVFFTDYVKSLESKGAITSNQNRLFSNSYYNFSIPINQDKFFNYLDYYCLNTVDPDYILIEIGNDVKNVWNDTIWIHKDSITDFSNYTKAKRPIICFNANIELFNYGTHRRSDINVVEDNITNLDVIKQKSEIVLNGVTYSKDTLPNGKISVLFTNLSNTIENNIIYDILFDSNGLSVFEIKTDGLDVSGFPVAGEIILDSSSSKEYVYSGSEWVLAQSKTRLNQPPLFKLFDEDGVELNDSTKYPNSTFAGSKLFSYSEDETESYAKDTILNLYLNYDSNGSIVFENNFEKDIFYYGNDVQIDSVLFASIYNSQNSQTLFTCWSANSTMSKQKVIDKFICDGKNKVFELSSNVSVNDNSVVVSLFTESESDDTIIIEKVLTENVDYVLYNGELLIKSINKNNEVQVSYYSDTFTDDNFYYEYPLSLTCNPNYNKISDLSYSDLRCFNKESTFPKKSDSNILLEMLLSSDDNIDIISSTKYCSNQYRLYMFKFISKITEYATTGKYGQNDDIDTIVDAALDEITRGLTALSPFYMSGVGVSSTYTRDYFIPPTPSFLGMYVVKKPTVDKDYTMPSAMEYIFCHDGSMIPAYNDFRDDVILNLENRIYMSIKDEFKESPVIDVNDFVSNAFYTKEYSYTEWNSVLEQFFILWCIDNNVDYKTNTTYSYDNVFTYNWSSQVSWATNQNLPGGWRGIYNYFYGTDKPHVAPWECLGFGEKPSYWDSVYGPAPYTSGNKKLWSDIANGVIDAYGTVDSTKSRSNMIYYIPVDEQGNLVDPVKANLLGTYPNIEQAAGPWSFGDGSPMETIWKRSTDYSFAVIAALYLLKPSIFMNRCWDTELTKNKNTTLLYSVNEPYSSWYIHGEVENGTKQYRYGIQQFIVNRLLSNSYNISKSLGNKIRGLDVRLSYRMSGFTNKENLTLTSDSYGVIPDENVSVIQYNSPINDVIQYSAMLIVKEDIGWKIYGYDNTISGFKTLTPNTNTNGFSIEVSNTSEYRTTFWNKNTKYVKNQIITYNGKTYVCNKNHTSGQFFETSYWDACASGATNKIAVQWYKTYKSTDVKIIPFGSVYKTYQDVANLMCSVELYNSYAGLRFDQDQNSHWYDCMKEFITWNLTASKNDFIVLSPLSDNVTLNFNFGNVLDVEEIKEGKWSILDINNKNIPEYNFDTIRTASKISVVPNVTDLGICGCKFYKNSIEHMVIIDNKTIFDDIIYSPELNMRQKRFYINGYKTSDWNGRLSASGFVISGNTIFPNYDTCADNFRHIYDIESVEYDDLQKRGRANIGFYESSTLSNLLVNPTNQFEIYQSIIQNKGTASSINRLLRSSIVSSYEDIGFYEEWAFRVGLFGSISNNQSLDIMLKQKDIKNDPQIIEFDVEYIVDELTFTINASDNWSPSSLPYQDGKIYDDYSYTLENLNVLMSGEYTDGDNLQVYVGEKLIFGNITQPVSGHIFIDLTDQNIVVDSENKLSIINSGNLYENIVINYSFNNSISSSNVKSNNIVLTDYISSTTNKLISKDEKWYSRQFDSDIVDFKKKKFNLNDKEFLKTAGYVNLDTVDWTATNKNAFYAMYQNIMNYVGTTNSTPSFTYTLNSQTELPYLYKVISSVTTGYFRINKIDINITQVCQLPIVLNIGTKSQLPDGVTNNYSSTTIERITSDKFTTIGTYTVYPSAVIYMDGTYDNDVFVQVTCDTTIPDNIDLGKFTVTFDIDYISSDNIHPGDRVWVYNDGVQNWNTYKLCDTGLEVYDISPNLSGTPVVSITQNVSDLSEYFNSTSNIVLAGTINGNVDLNNVQPKFKNSISTLVTGGNQTTPIFNMNVGAGMKVNSINMNVLSPFYTSDGSDLEFEIGDVKNTNYIADSYVINNPAPTSPSLSSVNPITVQAYNSQISILNGTPIVDVYVTRSGNIFGKVDSSGNIASPTECGDTVTTSFTWNLYSLADDGTVGTNSLGTGTFTFLNPDSASQVSSNDEYWKATIEVSLPSDGNYSFVISNVTGGTISNSTTNIEMTGSVNTYNLFDPTKVGNQNIDPTQFNDNANNGNVNVTLGNNTVGTAIITVEYEYTNGFEISSDMASITQSGNTFTITPISGNTTSYIRSCVGGNITDTKNTIITIGDDSVISDESYVADSSYVYGGNIFVWTPTRFKNENSFASSNKKYFVDGDYIEIDNFNGGWAICQISGEQLNVVYQQTDLIDTKLIESAYLYNIDTKIIEQYLDIYDPIKGFIPGSLKKDIEFISQTDPAIYNNSSYTNVKIDNSSIWTKNFVGKLWWNTRNSPYVLYEMGDTDYKINHWGQICPGTSVDIYEWVKSPVPPAQYESYVESGLVYSGFPKDPSGTIDLEISYSWVTDLEWNDITNEQITVYYFWVKNPTTIGDSNRDQTAYEISNFISSSDNGISTFSILDNNIVSISGLKQFITDNNTTLKLNWKNKESENNFHKEWVLVNENDSNTDIPTDLWNKMRNSILGFNIYDDHQTLTTSLISDFKPTDSNMFIDASDENINQIPVSGDVKIGNQWFTYGTVLGSKVSNVSGLRGLFTKGTTVQFIWNNENIKNVPDNSLTDYEAVGSLIRPEQSWFKKENGISSRYARKILISYLNDYFSQYAIVDNWYENFEVFSSSDETPNSTVYNYTVDSITDLASLSKTTTLNYNDCVLVNGNDSYNFWSLWAYQPFATSDNGGFVLIDFQKWRLQDSELWNYVDWYSDGYTSSDYPTYIFKDLNERDAYKNSIDVTLLYGTLVQVNQINSSDSRWTWYVYDGVTWTEVAKEKATIQLSENFYNKTYAHGIDKFDKNQIVNRDGTYELKIIIDALSDKFFTILEKNKLFFSMVKAAISDSYENDWVFKTSLLNIGGYIEEFNQRAILEDSKLPYIEDFINEFKPYHVKIKDFVYEYSNGLETCNIHVTDFDFPPYYDYKIKGTRNLYPDMSSYTNLGINQSNFIDGDTSIVKSSYEWSDWYNNFSKSNNYINSSLNYENWNPVRKIDSSIIFDRKQCSVNYGWDANSWESTANFMTSVFMAPNSSGTGPANIPVSYGKFSCGIFYFNYDGDNGYGNNINIPIIIYVTYLTSDDYQMLRPDIYGGYTEDKSVLDITDIQSITYNNKVQDGTIFFVENQQLHYVIVENLLLKLITTYKDSGTLPSNWYVQMGSTYVYDIDTLTTMITEDALAKTGLNYVPPSTMNNVTSWMYGNGEFIGNNVTYTACWIPYISQGWDAPFYGFDGALARISQYYDPQAGMIEKDDIDNLMNGCGYKGDVIDGGDFSTTDYDTTIIPKLLDLNGIPYPSDVTLSGGEISDPFTSQYTTPEEKCNVTFKDSLVIDIKEQSTNNNEILAYRYSCDMNGKTKIYDFANIMKNHSKYNSLVDGSTNIYPLMMYPIENIIGAAMYFEFKGTSYQTSNCVLDMKKFDPNMSEDVYENINVGLRNYGYYFMKKGFNIDDIIVQVPNKQNGVIWSDPSYNVSFVPGEFPFLNYDNFDDFVDDGLLKELCFTLEDITPDDIKNGITDELRKKVKTRILSNGGAFWYGTMLVTFDGYEDVTDAINPDFSYIDTSGILSQIVALGLGDEDTDVSKIPCYYKTLYTYFRFKNMKILNGGFVDYNNSYTASYLYSQFLNVIALCTNIDVLNSSALSSVAQSYEATIAIFEKMHTDVPFTEYGDGMLSPIYALSSKYNVFSFSSYYYFIYTNNVLDASIVTEVPTTDNYSRVTFDSNTAYMGTVPLYFLT